MNKEINLSTYLDMSMLQILGFNECRKVYMSNTYNLGLSIVTMEECYKQLKVEEEIKKLKHLKKVFKALIKQNLLKVNVSYFTDTNKEYLTVLAYDAIRVAHKKVVTLYVPETFRDCTWKGVINNMLDTLDYMHELLKAPVFIPQMKK